MQQETIGIPASVSTEADLRRGDLIYVPGHVMIYAGVGEVIHANGVSMMVRREPLAPLMRARGLDFAGFTVRRHPAASND
jgi:cell wall-associated NlpC family hydrolase